MMRKSMFITIATASAAALTAATVALIPEKNPVVPIPVVPYEELPPIEQKYVCDDCTINEAITLSFLQERGIEDKAALATVMGNIKQESNFTPNICEGGAKVSYASCTKGGYGLIQWTSKKRYLGLGLFASNYDGDPSELETQLRYMVNEPQWTKYELYLKSDGQSIAFYMNHAYNWLGWGIHGNRTVFSHGYYNRLTLFSSGRMA